MDELNAVSVLGIVLGVGAVLSREWVVGWVLGKMCTMKVTGIRYVKARYVTQY